MRRRHPGGLLAGYRLMLLVLGGLGPTLGACAGDATAPVPVVAGTGRGALAAEPPRLLTAGFESSERVALAGDEDLYLAGVYFDRDQPVYLAQVGIAHKGSASLVLLQRSYRIEGDSIFFDGGLLTPGVLEREGTILRTRIRHDGREIEVALPRIRD